MARYLTALLEGGANEHGRVLDADSVRTMFRLHFQPDPRVAGMALGFDPHTERGRVLICKGGTISGFLSALEMAPEAGAGVVVLANTGGLDNRGVPEPLAAALTRRLLGMPDNPAVSPCPPRPGGRGRTSRAARPTPPGCGATSSDREAPDAHNDPGRRGRGGRGSARAACAGQAPP